MTRISRRPWRSTIPSSDALEIAASVTSNGRASAPILSAAADSAAGAGADYDDVVVLSHGF
ncbi:hypothetical protein, partial [Mesorhizobium sp.]|uniref:hypothetical protein n=1 Tax=Mesorhizobium sp. TaxID=1871066 RepID=UPI002587D53A